MGISARRQRGGDESGVMMTSEGVIQAIKNGDWLWYVNGNFTSTARRHFTAHFSIVSGHDTDFSCQFATTFEELIAAMVEVAPLSDWYAE